MTLTTVSNKTNTSANWKDKTLFDRITYDCSKKTHMTIYQKDLFNYYQIHDCWSLDQKWLQILTIDFTKLVNENEITPKSCTLPQKYHRPYLPFLPQKLAKTAWSIPLVFQTVSIYAPYLRNLASPGPTPFIPDFLSETLFSLQTQVRHLETTSTYCLQVRWNSIK